MKHLPRLNMAYPGKINFLSQGRFCRMSIPHFSPILQRTSQPSLSLRPLPFQTPLSLQETITSTTLYAIKLESF